MADKLLAPLYVLLSEAFFTDLNRAKIIVQFTSIRLKKITGI